MKRFLSAAILLACAATADAAPTPPPTSPSVDLYYDFRFNYLSNVGGSLSSVEGFVRGLSYNGTSAAYSVEITGHSLGFGLGEYIGAPLANAWTMSNGVLQSFDFASFGVLNTGPAVTTANFVMSNAPGSSFDGTIGVGIGTFNFETMDINASGLYFTLDRSYNILPPAVSPIIEVSGYDIIRLPGAGESGGDVVGIAPVPLPAGVWTLLAALGVLGWSGRKMARQRPAV